MSVSWAEIGALLPCTTARERQVWERLAREREAVVNQRRKAQDEFDAQLACEQQYEHFLTAPLPELDGKRRCIACMAVVE